MCISLLSNEKTFKDGVKCKRKMAGMSEEYLENPLTVAPSCFCPGLLRFLASSNEVFENIQCGSAHEFSMLSV